MPREPMMPEEQAKYDETWNKIALSQAQRRFEEALREVNAMRAVLGRPLVSVNIEDEEADQGGEILVEFNGAIPGTMMERRIKTYCNVYLHLYIDGLLNVDLVELRLK